MFNLIQMMGKPGGFGSDDFTPPGDDHELQIDKDIAPSLSINGSTTNLMIKLPDDPLTGYCQEIWNNSSNFIGVTRFDGTRMQRVGPGGSFAARWCGTGWNYRLWEPETYAKFETELIGGATSAVTHTGRIYRNAAVAAFGRSGINGMLGGLFFRIDLKDEYGVWVSTNDSVPSVYFYKMLNKGKAYQYKALALRIGQALPAVGSEFAHRLGLGNTTDGTAGTNGVYFQISEDLLIKGVVRNASADVVFDSTIELSQSILSDLLMEVNHDATRADFWVGDTHIAQPVGAYVIPKAEPLVETIQLTKTDGVVSGTTEQEALYTDYVRTKLAFDSADRSDAP